MEDYNVELEGVTDFSKALDYMLNNFKDFFKVEVATILTDAASRAFSDILNNYVDDYENTAL